MGVLLLTLTLVLCVYGGLVKATLPVCWIGPVLVDEDGISM